MTVLSFGDATPAQSVKGFFVNNKIHGYGEHYLAGLQKYHYVKRLRTSDRYKIIFEVPRNIYMYSNDQKVMQENMAGFEEHFGEVKIMETPKGKQ